MKLIEWAKEKGITYRVAYTLFKLGKIPNAIQLGNRAIFVDFNSSDKEEKVFKKNNYYGQVFNDMTFIDHYLDDKRLWNIKCHCGKIFQAVPWRVMSFNKKSCGCVRDFTGQKYNSLTFIEESDKRAGNKKSGSKLWKLLCDCGNHIYRRPDVVINGHSSHCGCQTSKNKEDMNRIYDPIISSARSIWKTRYKDGCEFETFYEISQGNCFYCEKPPSNAYNIGDTRKNVGKGVSNNQLNNGTFIYNGLDRVDNTKDHSPDNIVPCCNVCNWMKRHLTLEEFYAHIERLSNHLREKKLIK